MSLGEYIGAGSGTTKLLLHLNGNSNDSSGNGNNGTDTNITYSQANGKFGQGAGFNGSTSRINIASQLINITSDSWTVNTFFKTSGSTNLASMITRGNSIETLQWRCELNNSDGKIKFTMRNSGDQNVTGITTTNDNKWHMATYVKSGTNTITLYLDGKYENTGNITNLSNISYNVVLGRLGDSTGNFYYNGKLDEIIIENVAWSAEKIKKYYSNSKARFAIL